MKINNKYRICNTCTIKLVRTAYSRKWWLKLIREPLKFSIIFLSKIYDIEPEKCIAGSQECHGCLRFIKTELKDKSVLFAKLNSIINPYFDRIIGTIVTKEEIIEAKEFAKNSTGEGDQDETV